jgi:hypothetical protein
MVRLISGDPTIVAVLERVPEALIKYQFLITAGNRRFDGPSSVLRQTSDKGLLSRIQEYEQSDNALEGLKLDIHRRLGYSFKVFDYGLRVPIGQVGVAFPPSDRVELLKLQAAFVCRIDAVVALSNELLRCDLEFRQLAHLHDKKSAAGVVAHYVYRNGCIWTAHRNLTDSQWIALIDQKRGKEDAILAALDAGGRSSDGQSRFICVEVRREVWRRDEGKCIKCGSQERIEFDHIIPVTMGGSNTTRNIQLLCETCNRDKAATLG